MSDALFIFTFSPIQRFIVEARRTSDLRVGSQILVQLSRAVCQAAIDAGGVLIFPSGFSQHASHDLPNKVLVKTDWSKLDDLAKAVLDQFWCEWFDITATARKELEQCGVQPDPVWEHIWKRQTECFWEVYWAATEIGPGGYATAYDQAEKALAARKRTRVFETSLEEHIKDSLSGKRQALETAALDARKYWQQISLHPHCSPSRLRRNSPERLDAIGAVKRFSRVADKANRLFASTSTVASQDFLTGLLEKPEAVQALAAYRKSMESLLGDLLFETRSDLIAWPYDGVLFYLESLTPRYLEEEFGKTDLRAADLRDAQDLLRTLYIAAGRHPSPYYAILMLDGDNMGQRVYQCLSQPDPEGTHHAFSASLSQFSQAVLSIVPGLSGTLVYNGGDDVLTLLPLSQAFGAYLALAEQFDRLIHANVSAGIAIVHRNYPLGAALRAAREAEHRAKSVPGKDAVCLCVMKRSGETSRITSPRTAVGNLFEQAVVRFKQEAISSKFAYDVLKATYALPQVDDKFKSELKRLVNRHRDSELLDSPAAAAWIGELSAWASRLSGSSEELARWLVFARFVAAGGEE